MFDMVHMRNFVRRNNKNFFVKKLDESHHNLEKKWVCKIFQGLDSSFFIQ
jgi:hypothetical protein